MSRTLIPAAGVAAVLAIALAACGGGGGGTMATSGPQTSISGSIATADPVKNEGAARAVSNAAPRFGSVTQSSNTDGSGVTTDRASASYDGSRLTVTVSRQDGSSFSVNTAENRIATQTTTSSRSGLDIVESVLVKQTGTGAATRSTLAYTAHAKTGDGATDWLAGGYWLHLSGDIAGTVSRAEAGAFVDGPQLRTNPTLPNTGTASYSGETVGLYAARYGTDFADVAEGSHEIGRYAGDIALTADFGSDTISGEINNIVVSGAFIDGATSRVRGFNDVVTRYTGTLGAASIQTNGRFQSNQITLAHPDLSIAETRGSWGGKFSSVADQDGNPQLVAGTHGGTATTAGGTRATFVGAFYGGTGRPVTAGSADRQDKRRGGTRR